MTVQGKRPPRVATSVSLIVLLVLGGTAAASHAARTGDADAQERGALTWAPCADLEHAECATLDVPMDYGRRGGTTIPLALSRVLATDPSRRVGALVVNPGGPGVAGRSLAVDLQEELVEGSPSDQEVAARFDLVGFDPRGVGASSPVECGDLQDLDRADYTPDDEAEEAALARTMRRFARACAAGTGKLLRFIGTEDAARDLNEIRRALGEEKLTYLGFSYGTLLGATYAQLFPRRVRALALDGAYDAAVPGAVSVAEQAASLDAAFAKFASECGERPGCVARFPDGVNAVFDRVVARADVAPLPVPSRTGADLTEGQLVTTLGLALFGLPSTAPLIEEGLALADAGDGSPVAEGFDIYADVTDGVRSNASEATVAVNCLDYRWPRGSSGVHKIVAGAQRQSPRLGQTFLREFAPCAYWSVEAKPLPVPAAVGAPPILVIGTTGDPATSYAGAQALASQLRSGVLLTREGEGHTAYSHSACINDAVASYLIDLTIPAKGTVCPSE